MSLQKDWNIAHVPHERVLLSSKAVVKKTDGFNMSNLNKVVLIGVRIPSL